MMPPAYALPPTLNVDCASCPLPPANNVVAPRQCTPIHTGAVGPLPAGGHAGICDSMEGGPGGGAISVPGPHRAPGPAWLRRPGHPQAHGGRALGQGLAGFDEGLVDVRVWLPLCKAKFDFDVANAALGVGFRCQGLSRKLRTCGLAALLRLLLLA